MKKTLRHGLTLIGFISMGYFAQAQQYTATLLRFPNDSENEHEFGFSAVEFNDYSVYGTEFNHTVNVHKGNALLFQTYMPYPDQTSGTFTNGFGHAVGMNQDWVAIGAYTEDVTPTNSSSYQEGKVYLSKNINGVPQNNFTTTITSQNPSNNDRFGEALDMDGEWMVVGAPGASTGGFIEIWKQNGTGWARMQKFQPTGLNADAKFGFSVAIQGDYIVVSAYKAKTIFVYKNTNNTWSLLAEYKPNLATWAGPRNYISYLPDLYTSEFGYDVDVYGDKIIVGDPYSSVQKVAILTISGNQVSMTKELLPPGYSDANFTWYGEFGHSVAIEEDMAIVGAPRPYGPDITDKNLEGKAFFYANNFQYLGYLNSGNPSGRTVGGLGKSVTINNGVALVGAEFTDNLESGRVIEGTVLRIPFYNFNATGNTPPTVTITSPTVNSDITAPAMVTIEAYADDADGSISTVQFYNGSTLLGSDNTAPYTFTWNNVSAGSKYIYVKAIDNQGKMAINDASFTVKTSVPAADISGPVCASNNQTITYELSPAKRANATGYGWYFTGSTQSFTPSGYQTTLVTGNNYGAGQVCVGVSYSAAPHYTSYCITVPKCTSLREALVEDDFTTVSEIVSAPNPFQSNSTILFPNQNETAKVKVMDASGAVMLETEATGSILQFWLKPLHFVQ